MELIYLWISNYKNIIVNQGFNLSSKFSIDFNPILRKVSIKDSENFIDGFFGEDIINITGIVGENGSGKSTLLKYFIHECFTPVSINPDRSGDMIIYKSDESTLNIYYIDILNIQRENVQFDTNKYRLKIQSSDTNIYWNYIGLLSGDEKVDSLRPTQFVYFSGVFDLDETTNSYNGLNNACTNYRVNKDHEELMNSSSSKLSSFEAFKIMEIDRQIDYIISKKKQKFDLFRLPDKIGIKAGLADSVYLKNTLSRLSSNSENKDSLDRLERIFLFRLLHYVEIHRPKVETVGYLSIIKYEFRINFLYNLVRYLKSMTSIIKDESTLIRIGKYYLDCFKESKLDIDRLKDNILKAELEISKDFTMSLLSECVKNYIVFENLLFNEIVEYKESDNQLWFGAIYVNLAHVKLNQLREAYKKSTTITDYLNWFWRDMSSGEKAYLSIFSRLFNLTDKTNEGLQESKYIQLFLDEPELYFHPKWQTKIIKFLIDELPVIFPNKKIQIFITSHSPFILSDLPIENTVLMRKGTDVDIDYASNSLENKCIVNNAINRNTFGANIHELFMDSFFLKNGLIGEFAKKKITDLFSEIQAHNEINVKSYKTFEKRISIIGEPLIKEKLMNLIQSKILKNDLTGRRTFLEIELKRLDILINKIEDEKN